jgi:hypothetical protein
MSREDTSNDYAVRREVEQQAREPEPELSLG